MILNSAKAVKIFRKCCGVQKMNNDNINIK